MDLNQHFTTPETESETAMPLWPSNVIANQIAVGLRMYASLFVVFVGVPGNILSLIVMSRPHFRNTTSSFYLRALAVSDSCYLIFFILQRAMLGWGLREALDGTGDFYPYCLFYHYTAYVPKLSGMYMIIIMTYDRMLSLVFPLKSRSWSTMRAAKITVTLATIAALIEASPRFFVQRSEEFKTWLCPFYYPIDMAITLHNYYNIHSSVCGCLVLLANIVIVFSLMKSARDRKRLMGDGPQAKEKLSSVHNKQITVMLSTVSFFYILALVPAQFHFQFWPNTSGEIRRQTGWRKFSQEIFMLFEELNYAINFWLYVFSCTKFRHCVRDLFRRSVQAGAKTVSSVNSTGSELQ